MSVTNHPRSTQKSATKSCYLCWILPRSWVERSLDGWVEWKVPPPLMTQGLANVCCLDLVSNVPGVNLASGHSTRHAQHFSTCWAHSICGDQRLPRGMEWVALWTKRYPLLQGSWSQSGEPVTRGEETQSASVKCWPSRGCGLWAGLPC